MRSEEKIKIAFELVKSMYRLTVMRDIMENAPFKALHAMLGAVAKDDIVAIEKNYHRLTHQLICANPRRISGNLLTDYIIAWIVESENEFSTGAAAGISDPTVYSAMLSDIKILTYIGKTVIRNIKSLTELSDSENMKVSITTTWSSKPDSPYDDKANINIPIDAAVCSLIPWDYEPAVGIDSYISDYKLGSIYEMLLSDDVNGAAEELWRFFNEYGTGVFIKNRVFVSNATTLLTPISEPPVTADSFIYENERDAMLNLARRFTDLDERENLLICGARNTGKTSLLLSLIHELADVHMVYISGRDISRLDELFGVLKCQPLKFIVLLDDADMCENEALRCIGSIYQSANILVIAAADEGEGLSCFDNVINLELPDLDRATEYICSVTGNDNAEAVRNMCINYQIETKKTLSCRAVNAIIKKLK